MMGLEPRMSGVGSDDHLVNCATTTSHLDQKHCVFYFTRKAVQCRACLLAVFIDRDDAERLRDELK